MPKPARQTVHVRYFGGPLDGSDKVIGRDVLDGRRQLLAAGLKRITMAETAARAQMTHPPAIPTVMDVYVVTPGQWPAGPVTLRYAGQDVT